MGYLPVGLLGVGFRVEGLESISLTFPQGRNSSVTLEWTLPERSWYTFKLRVQTAAAFRV